MELSLIINYVLLNYFLCRFRINVYAFLSSNRFRTTSLIFVSRSIYPSIHPGRAKFSPPRLDGGEQAKMKFMRLGSKPDTFESVGNLRSVGSEIPSDFTVVVDGVTFYVHKFPLLCKSAKLQRLLAHNNNNAAAEAAEENKVELEGFPGGAEAFEMCAKFCYGVKIVVNAHNVVCVRCAAEYLEMTEGAEKGNLILKLDVFLHTYILQGWKDSIIALKSTAAGAPFIQPMARHHLQIVSRCVRSIVSKVLVSPAAVDWSFTQTRRTLITCGRRRPAEITPCSSSSSKPPTTTLTTEEPVHADWWIEDIAELEIDMYADIIMAVKATERMPPRLIGDALEFYTLKSLPVFRTAAEAGGGCIHDDDIDHQRKLLMMGYGGANYDSNSSTDMMAGMARERQRLERIICLLPGEKGCTSCRFVLNLLKAASVVGVSVSLRNELIRRAGQQLEEAQVCDLLVPRFTDPASTMTSGSININVYDVDLVQSLVEEYFLMQQSPPTTMASSSSSPSHEFKTMHLVDKRLQRRSRSAENMDAINDIHNYSSRRSATTTHGAKLRVAKLIDGYLAHVSDDPNLEASKFIALAMTIPSFARPTHDGLYRAIDVYLKTHPGLPKNERKKLCRLLDSKKLSMDACRHASQNERLPLRTVVQVLFFLEQAISNMESQEGMAMKKRREGDVEKWEEVQQSFEALQKDLASIKVKLSEVVVEKEHHGPGSTSGATAQGRNRIRSSAMEDDHEEISARSHASSSTSSSSSRTRKFLSRILWPASTSAAAAGQSNFIDHHHHHHDSNFNNKSSCIKC